MDQWWVFAHIQPPFSNPAIDKCVVKETSFCGEPPQELIDVHSEAIAIWEFLLVCLHQAKWKMWIGNIDEVETMGLFYKGNICRVSPGFHMFVSLNLVALKPILGYHVFTIFYMDGCSEKHFPSNSGQGFPVHMKTTGWWFQPTPLKNDRVRQLGLWHSLYMESHKIPWFQTTNQTMQWSTLTFAHSNLKMVEGNSKESEPIPCQICLRVKWDAVLLDTIVDSLHAQSQWLSQKRRIQTAANHLKHCTGSMYYTH